MRPTIIIVVIFYVITTIIFYSYMGREFADSKKNQSNNLDTKISVVIRFYVFLYNNSIIN